jgi:hypothetical protein
VLAAQEEHCRIVRPTEIEAMGGRDKPGHDGLFYLMMSEVGTARPTTPLHTNRL